MSVADEEQVAAEEANKIINEEYKVWKKNAPFLYDVVVTHALDWPTLTCQWFPDKESPTNKPYTTHRLLFGTHTSGQAQDYVQIATVQLPKREVADDVDRSTYDEERGELGGHNPSTPARISITQMINHEGEVNRARFMPQNPDLIATKAVSGEVLVFDRTKHSSDPDKDGVCRPDIRLQGQTKEGYGLAWSPTKMGHILGASEDMTICHWDITSYSKTKTTIEPLAIYRGHSSIVGDVSWHATKETIFASVGDDKQLMIWDTREASKTQASHHFQAHEKEILAVAFSPANEFLIATGSSDKTVALWDIRKMQASDKLHSFEQHADEVLHLAWSPHSPTVFASASADRRIHIWDLSKIGLEQSPEDAEDGAPELVFVHGGHTARPTDFCWAPGEDENWTLVSAAEDNVVQVWAPSMYVWAGEEVRVEEKELEDVKMEVDDNGSRVGNGGDAKGKIKQEDSEDSEEDEGEGEGDADMDDEEGGGDGDDEDDE